MPPKWWAAWRKVQSQKTRTHKEDGQAAAAETAVKMGYAYPIWTGVITKSWIWMLGWGNITDTKIIKFTRKHRKILLEQAQKWWKTRIKLIDETKTERNRRMCTSTGTIKLSAEAIKTGLWNEGVNIMNIQGNRGKRKWTYKFTEPKKKKQYNQNTLTEMEGFSRKIEEKKTIPQTMEQIKKERNKEENKQQLHITKWTEETYKKRKEKDESEPKVNKKQRNKQQQIKMDKLEQQHRSAMEKWLTKTETTKRERQMPTKDDAPEPLLNKATREVIKKMRGLIIPVHGDGACWYRAMAKICEKTPMQFIRDMEQSV